MGHFLKPDLRYRSVEEVDLKVLKERDVNYILLDLDNTIIDFYRNMSDSVITWVNKAKEMNFKVYILSNTNKIDKVSKAAKTLNIEYISSAGKPFKRGFKKAIKRFGIIENETAMIGDQVLTDVVGANTMNMISVYVDPIAKKEHFYTRWKRPLEAWILRLYK